MEALTYTTQTNKLELKKLPLPIVSQADEVLIKVAFSGICGTDLHIIEGAFPVNDKETVTLGHEFSGVVVDIGSDVTIFKKGDKVAVDPNAGCNSCDFCHSGRPHFCQVGRVKNTVGIWRNGGWADYCVAPVNQVFKLPESTTLEQGALTEPLSCITHGWDVISPITVGMKILVIGAGIIGNLWVCTLHLQGHRNVTVSEPNMGRLNLLQKLDTGYNLITPDQLKKNQDSDPTYLFDLVIDCSGYPPAIEQAVALVQRGGKLCCFGVASPDAEIKIKPYDLFLKEMQIYGILVNPFSFPKSFGLIEAMGDRYLNYDKIGIKTYALKDYQEALDTLKQGTISKAMFKFDCSCSSS